MLTDADRCCVWIMAGGGAVESRREERRRSRSRSPRREAPRDDREEKPRYERKWVPLPRPPSSPHTPELPGRAGLPHSGIILFPRRGEEQLLADFLLLGTLRSLRRAVCQRAPECARRAPESARGAPASARRTAAGRGKSNALPRMPTAVCAHPLAHPRARSAAAETPALRDSVSAGDETVRFGGRRLEVGV